MSENSRLFFLPLLFILLFIFSSTAAFAEKKPKPEGETLYRRKTCFACHGKNGAKAIMNYPNLAGQDKDYLLTQVRDIKSGKRVASKDADGHPRTKGMADVMHLLSDEELVKISTWLSTLPPAKPKPRTEEVTDESIARGKALYVSKGCIACHGPDGKKGLIAGYPTLLVRSDNI
jgi:cytochrome c553